MLCFNKILRGFAHTQFCKNPVRTFQQTFTAIRHEPTRLRDQLMFDLTSFNIWSSTVKYISSEICSILLINCCQIQVQGIPCPRSANGSQSPATLHPPAAPLPIPVLPCCYLILVLPMFQFSPPHTHTHTHIHTFSFSSLRTYSGNIAVT